MKLKLKKEINLEKGTIVTGTKVDDTLVIEYKGEEILSVQDNVIYNRIFNYRNNFKLRVIDDFTLEFVLFSDLHRHSGYSLLDGANTIEDLVEKTEFSGALTDHGNMFGSLEYWKQMKKAGKKAITGIEVYTESLNGKKDRNHLVLLAKNEEGFHNLVKLTSLSWKNVYRKPQVKHEWLKEYGDGLICLTACLGGEIPKKLQKDDYEGANEVIQSLKAIFKDDLYIEVQRHNIDIEEKVNKSLIKLAKENNLKVVATTDSHYKEKMDEKIHEYLLCMQTKKTISEKHFKFEGTNYHLASSEEILDTWNDYPEFVINTLEVADKCEFEFDLGHTYMPTFEVPEGFKDEEEYFVHLCWEGFKERYEGTEHLNDKEYKDRLQFEIDTINNMGFPGYFLIVWDYINFARQNGILVGPGRGSACGSLVAYCLRITDIDPIKYDLLFERFLNPSRVSMPDIDADLADTRRGEVIDYVIKKYGAECVSRIVTFGTMASKAVLRDVGRVLELPISFVDKIAKAVPSEPKMTLDKALKESPTFLAMYQNDEQVKNLVDISKKLEGLPKNLSTHACGILIARSPVDDYIPQVMMEEKDTGALVSATQYNMAECEEMGILKMDMLGLRTLGVFERCLNDVNKKRVKLGQNPLTLEEIPLYEVDAYKFIALGKTAGVFQLESPGMTEFMKQLFQDVVSVKTDEIDGEELFERLIAGISLYRPGPIDEIPNYIKYMLNPSQIQYDLPELEPILKNTYSTIVYQEQCMYIVRVLAGFSKGDADNVRKAFAKKKEKMVEELGVKFLYGEKDKDGNYITKGCLQNGIDKDVAVRIWEKMKKFGRYAFNKSHATGYAVIAIRTAWLALHYPVEFFTATLNSFIEAKSTNSDKVRFYINVCKNLNINILQADLNLSDKVFSVEGDNIRFGLKGIKNLGGISENIIEERNSRGKFKSLQDFVERMARYESVSSRVIESLTLSGALDSFPKSRQAKINAIPTFQNIAKKEKKAGVTNQISLFDIASDYEQAVCDELEGLRNIEFDDCKEFDNQYKYAKEKEYTGYYVTGHPLDDYEQYFENEDIQEIVYFVDTESNEEGLEEDEVFGESLAIDNEKVTFAGVLKDTKAIVTKKNEIMYVGKIEDRTSEISFVMYSKQAQKFGSMIIDGNIVVLKGQIKISESYGIQVIASSIVDVKTLALVDVPEKIIVMGSKNLFRARIQFKKVRSLLNKTLLNKTGKGLTEVFFIFDGKQYKVVEDGVKHSYGLINDLQDIVSEKNVIVRYKK